MPALILAYLARLRFRNLFLVTASIFLVDVLVPDLIPFVDELLFGALTLLFAAWKRDKQAVPASAPPPLPHAPDR
jgi:hypothetical protein